MGSKTIGLLLLALATACGAPTGFTADLYEVVVEPPKVQPVVDGGVEPWEQGWCRKLAGGPSANEEVSLSLSALHARARYFGAEPSARAVDEALVGAVRTREALDSKVARAYGLELDSVCISPPDERPLPEARVELQGVVAVVQPGWGPISIPQEATAVVLDLRDLPDAPGLRDALHAAAGELLFSALPPLRLRMHRRVGLTDESVFKPTVYSADVAEVPAATVPTRAAVDRPLAVLTGERMPPSAVELAAALRVAGRAHLWGADLRVEVAESSWATGFTDASAAVRTADLVDGVGRFPDVVPADRSDADLLYQLPGMEDPLPIVERTAARPLIAARNDFQVPRDKTIDTSTLRAALLTAHGASKLFFPYFETLEDHTDSRLAETLLAAPAATTDRHKARDLLRRFNHVLQDGHGWVSDQYTWPSGMLPLVLDHVEGQTVVARSYAAGVDAGDVVTAVNGESALAWLSRQVELSYGATTGHRHVTALNELVTYSGNPVVLELRDTAGGVRTVALPQTGWSQLNGFDLYSGSTRPHGWLAALGAPDVYYFNLDGRHVASDAEINSHLALAASARGIVLDMRGHPANGGARWDPYQFLQRIIRQPFDSPRYRVPVLTGPQLRSDIRPYEASYLPIFTAPTYAGPVVLIVDPRAVSFSEDFAMMIIGAGRLTKVVGRPSAGTTGSVTGLMLPGGFSFHLTGMEARWPDGRPFFGVGAVPDAAVEPTAADYAAGIDAPLLRAVAELP